MICEICHIREASTRFTQLVNLEKKEIAVCKICAEKKGISNPLAGLNDVFENLAYYKHSYDDSEAEREKEADNTICKACNTAWKDFKDNGLLGCSSCYIAFKENLKHMLRRIHGSEKHIGNRPAKMRDMKQADDLNELKIEQRKAIERQEFEHAAKLRDKIRDIEANLNRSS
ncbi:hypothetical protein GF337_12655 [candidate division KSB1 bacterium]|nr:hypothetical protein [candidate division KSB1 bacterium]